MRLWSVSPWSTNKTSFKIWGNWVGIWLGETHRKVGCGVRFIRDNSIGWNEGDNIQDPDGNIYNTVQIGTQIWTSQNWASTKLSNGSSIPNLTDNTWNTTESPAYCNYNNDEIYVF